MNLHKQLSHLQKVISANVERARHVTLLQQLLHGGLLERVHRENSNTNTTQQLQVKLPAAEMNDLAWDELVNEGICIQVRFSNTTLQIGNSCTKGIAHAMGVRYWGGDITQVFGKPLKQTLQIDLPAYCHKITVYDNKVFAPIRDRKVIQVYNKQRQLQDTITVEGCPVCTEKTPNGDLLVCCYDTGLFLLTEKSKQPVNIARGKYSDMCLYGDKVYTWDYKNKQIVEFIREKTAWKRHERVVNVTVSGSDKDSLLVRHSGGRNTGLEFFVCLYLKDTILRMSEKGELISQYGDWRGQGEGRPRMCGVDSGGQILVAEGDNHTYEVVNTDTGIWKAVFTCNYNVFDAKVENEHTIWFSRYSNGKYSIARLEPAKY